MSKGTERAIARHKAAGTAVGGWQIAAAVASAEALSAKAEELLRMAKVIRDYPEDDIFLEDEVVPFIDGIITAADQLDDILVLLFGRAASIVEQYARGHTARDDNYLRYMSNAIVSADPNLTGRVGIDKPKS